MEMRDEVIGAITRLRRSGTDLADIEVKAAEGGMPKRVVETLSSFSNTEGGLLVLGVREASSFEVVEVDAAKLASGLAGMCAESVEPPIRPEIEIVTVDGRQIVAARIDELPNDRKPCYVKAQGMERGSYRRSHDGNHALSTYEIHVLMASRGQPTEDAEPVLAANLDDLDGRLVDALVERLRQTRAVVFGEVEASVILEMVGAVKLVDGEPRPTIAGLLSLGRYPQRHFPQLNITFVVFPTITGEPLVTGERFLDNQAIDGPIPMMVNETMAVLRRNMKRRSIVAGVMREDVWEYPEEAIRELVTNALLHRDYHAMARGTQVRVEMYPDRLEIISPGGLHGPVVREALLADRVSSSRNAHLAKLLEDVPVPGTDRRVCENRASGLLATAAALRRAGMQPPKLLDAVRSFTATVFNHGLLDDEAIAWLSTIETAGLNDHQRLGLAFARRHGSVTNHQYRTVTGVDARTATRELSEIATRGLLEKQSDRRWARWTIAVATEPAVPDGFGEQLILEPPRRGTASSRIAQIEHLLASGPRSASELAHDMRLSREGVLRYLRRMETEGRVQRTAEHRSSKLNRWRMAHGENVSESDRAGN